MSAMTCTEATTCLLALLALPGLGPAKVRKIALVGRPLCSEAPPNNLSADPEIWREAVGHARQVVARCEQAGIAAISIVDPRYPKLLLDLSNAPPVLFCRGDLSLLARRTVGVIGTRTSDVWGEAVAGRVGVHLADQGVVVCNGLANGIDAHAVGWSETGNVLRPGAIGVMAAGLDLIETRLCPSQVRARASALLAAGGLLVSEYPPQVREVPHTTIAACRIQAGLSAVLLLVQSARDGGSRFAVRAFASLPRRLAYVVPPEDRADAPPFQANLLLDRGLEGVCEFAGMKKSSAIRASLVPIRSRDDYDALWLDPDEGKHRLL